MPVKTVENKVGEIEAHPLYPAGNLASRIAGRMGYFASISSALRAGYRSVEENGVTSIQQTVVTQPETPKPDLGGYQGGFALIIRNPG